jgi:hypothetical protein
MLTAIAAALLAAQAPAPAPAAPGLTPRLAEAPDYTQANAWLCLPGRSDSCSQRLATTALGPNGYASSGQAAPNPEAKVDCFYVYPTVSRDPGMNSDLEPGLEEKGAAWVQLGRLTGVCRPFAPVYRQMTLSSIGKALAGVDVRPNFAIAYGDVLAAWRDFLAHRNGGRPFILVGHSQGSIHLQRLIQEEIEGKPIARKMVAAVIPGWAVEVPEGKTVGGTFKSTPLCTRTAETGCVLTWMSFRAESPPPEPSLLGRAARPGMTAACTNPAALGSDAPAKLDSYWYVLSRGQFEAIVWSIDGAPPTPFLRTQGLITGQCRHDGKAGWLAIADIAKPGEKWTQRIPGDVYLLGQLNKGWGLHLIDMNVAQGDLVRVLGAAAEAAVSAGATPARRSAGARPKSPPR